jgi:hypothetical protein
MNSVSTSYTRAWRPYHGDECATCEHLRAHFTTVLYRAENVLRPIAPSLMHDLLNQSSASYMAPAPEA